MIKLKFIENANITHVSLVDAAANKKKFYIAKSEEKGIEINIKISKAVTEGEEHFVWAPVFEPNVEDSQGEQMTPEEIEKAADKFLENLKKEDESGIDNQHSFKAEDGLFVAQSFVAQEDMSMFGETVIKGTWMMKVRILDEDIWNKIESGEITGLSMGGTGDIIEKSGGEKMTEDFTKEEDGLIKKFMKFIKKESIEKGELADKAKADVALSTLRSVYWKLDDMVWDAKWDGDEEQMSELFKEFAEIATQVSDSFGMEDIIKSIKKNKDGERMNEDQVKEIVKSAMEEATKEPETVEKKEEINVEVIKNIVVEAVKPLQESNAELKKQLDEANEKIVTLEKSTNGSNQTTVEKDAIVKNGPSYMKHFA